MVGQVHIMMLNQIDIESVVIGVVFLLAGYTISIICNILLVKGNLGFLPGTIKLYSIAVIICVLCNSIDVICVQYNITDCFYIFKVLLVLVVLYKICTLKNSGDPRWVADYKDIYLGELDPKMPFSSTEGMSFCIMVAYTFPTIAAMIVMAGITVVQGLCEIEKYKFKRTGILCIMVEAEVLFSTWLVHLSYSCDILKALFCVALIGMVFNIILGSINGKLLDFLTGDRYLNK